MATTTTGQRNHKTAPSPLSQSTSALHLEPPDYGEGVQQARKLSKRRKPVLQSLFSNHPVDSNAAAPQAVSLPATPNRTPSPSKTDDPHGKINRPLSALPAPYHRKERRTSILGRLAKKFSLLRKPTHRLGNEDDWHHVDAGDARRDSVIRQSVMASKHLSTGSFAVEHGKTGERTTARPRSLVGQPQSHEAEAAKVEDPGGHRSSSPVSLDAHFSIGRLTIANPDTPTREEANFPTRYAPRPVDVKSDSRPVIPVPPKDPPSRAIHLPQSAHPSSKLDRAAASLPMSPPSNSTTYLPTVAILPDMDVPWTQSPIDVVETPKVASDPVQDAKDQHKSPSAESMIPFPVSPEPSLPEIPSLLSPPMNFAAFSSSLPEIPSLLSPPAKFAAIPPSAHDSPLSTASLFVNPPTPHVPETPMPTGSSPHVPAPPPRPPIETRRSSQDRQPNGVVRQTETFKLVRSSSGNLYPATETIIAAGHQWEVVESDQPRRSKTKEKSSRSKDRESTSRREHRRQDKPRDDPVEANPSHRKSSQPRRSATGRTADTPIAHSSSTPASSHSQHVMPRHGRGYSAPTPVGYEEHRSSRKRDEERTADRKHHDGEVRPKSKNVDKDKPQPPLPPPTPRASQVERRPSLSARPISELPSSAELNALRARDVWDMDRLLKGRSMYETEPPEISPPEHTRESTGSYTASKNREDSTMPTTHGSSHTSFVVQTSYHGQSSSYPNIYHSMPVAPPPIIYSPPQVLHQFPPHHGYHNAHPPFPSSFYLPSSDMSAVSSSPRPSLSNPLPAPPRESSYKLSPLPASPLDPNRGRSSDYWTQLASVTAAH